MDMDEIKIQVYMAKTQEEYDKALEWVKEQDIEDIKEVGEMPTTDWFGDPMSAFIFVFSAPIETMMKLSSYMNAAYIPTYYN